MDSFLARKQDCLIERARIVQTIRAFFVEQNFLEVETPQRIPVNAPEANIKPFESCDWQLQTSPELAMKRLLAAGYEKIFQISHCWRAEERGSRHLAEFTMLEWYRSHCDYNQLMTDCENLFRILAPHGKISYQGCNINLTLPFERLTVSEAFSRYTDTSMIQALADDCFDEQLVLNIEPKLGIDRPTILHDYPSELAALARRKPDQPELAERFELYIAGLELANAFSELNDPQEQRQRFNDEIEVISTKTKTSPQLPEPFLADLRSMPEAAGIAFGIDRLIMLMTDSASIDEVVTFTPEDL